MTSAMCLCVSVKGEVLCSLKDFRINIFVPGDEDLILLTLGSAASRLLLHERPADSLQQQGDERNQTLTQAEQQQNTSDTSSHQKHGVLMRKESVTLRQKYKYLIISNKVQLHKLSFNTRRKVRVQ